MFVFKHGAGIPFEEHPYVHVIGHCMKRGTDMPCGPTVSVVFCVLVFPAIPIWRYILCQFNGGGLCCSQDLPGKAPLWFVPAIIVTCCTQGYCIGLR